MLAAQKHSGKGVGIRKLNEKEGIIAIPVHPRFFRPTLITSLEVEPIEYALALTKKVLVDCLASYSRTI